MDISLPRAVLVAIAGCLGAVVGSFLNVCIHRLPREMSVRQPVRSFCPNCCKTLPWFYNIPILSWIWLRGRCAFCKQPIPMRYLMVECLTAALFAATTWNLGASQPGVLTSELLLLSLLIPATFIDLEHLIIPDEITWGGVAAGILCSSLWPQLHTKDLWWQGLAFSIAGAATGYALLWAVAELGRLAMGRQRLTFDPPAKASWVREGDSAQFTLDGESMDWASLFFRGCERVQMQVRDGTLDGRPAAAGEWVWEFEKLHCDQQSFDLNQVERVELRTTTIVLPREVMGYGDVKFLAAIGAFLGWKAVLFSVLTGSILGALLGAAAVACGRRDMASKIPFGPYLAAGAVLWMFGGPALIDAYWRFITDSGASLK